MTPERNTGDTGKRWAVFLDRDGTVTREKGYLRDPQDLELEAGSADAIRLLNRAGIPAVLVTNQSGIARGYYTEKDVDRVHRTLHGLLAQQNARLDGIFFCPHHPEGSVEVYRRRCACRKPATGLLRKASADLSLQLSGSYLIGDKRTDMQCAASAGMVGVLVTTGYGWQEWAESLNDPASPQPDLVAGSLREAVQRILSEEHVRTEPGGPGNRSPLWSCKFISREHLRKRLAAHRARGETVVLADGVFDLLHAGHTEYLQEARKQGDVLVVGVHDDTSAAALKGPARPVYPAQDRIVILSALACVDYCVLLREPRADDLLGAVRPDIHAKGSDDAGENVSGNPTEERFCGEVRIVGPPKTRSTAATIRTLSGRRDG